MVCNGHAELCDRKYGNVTFLGAHDSFAFSPNPIARKWLSVYCALLVLICDQSQGLRKSP